MTKIKYTMGEFVPPYMDKDKIQEYGECLQKIAEENNGTVTPELVIEEARDEDSKIHECFEWEEPKAAYEFLKDQARQLIRTVLIVVKWDDHIEEHKAFYNVKVVAENDGDEEKRVYATFERVVNEPRLKRQVIQDALKEVEGWQRRYNEYKELGKIFRAVKKTKNQLVRKLKIKV